MNKLKKIIIIGSRSALGSVMTPVFLVRGNRVSNNSDKLLFCEQIQRRNLNSASEMKANGRK